MELKLVSETGYIYVFETADGKVEIKVIAKSPKEAAYTIRQMFLNTNHNYLKITFD